MQKKYGLKSSVSKSNYYHFPNEREIIYVSIASLSVIFSVPFISHLFLG